MNPLPRLVRVGVLVLGAALLGGCSTMAPATSRAAKDHDLLNRQIEKLLDESAAALNPNP